MYTFLSRRTTYSQNFRGCSITGDVMMSHSGPDQKGESWA